MRSKTKKLIWAAPLVAAFAVIGALTMFLTPAADIVFADSAPGQVKNFKVASDGRTALNLSWDAPDGGAPMGYRVDVSPDGHKWEELVAKQSDTGYTHSGLLPPAPATKANVTRYYRVFALNSHGPGAESDILQATTDGVVAPLPVKGLTATADGATKINLKWNAPTDDGGMPITGYRIQSGDNAATFTDLVADTKSTDRAYTHPKLTAETTKYYRVYAINKVGDSGGPSNIATAKTGKANPPSPVQNLRAVQNANDNGSSPSISGVRLYWNEPADNGGRSVTSYVISVSSKATGENWTGRRSFDTAGTQSENDGSGTAAQAWNYAFDGDEFVSASDDFSPAVSMQLRFWVQAKHANGTSRTAASNTVTLLADDGTLSPATPASVTGERDAGSD